MRWYVLFALFSMAIGAGAADESAKADVDKKDTEEKEEAAKPVAPVSKEASIQIDGKRVPYRVTTGKLQLKEESGKARASVFHVSYVRTDISDLSKRPVMFAFNGGPGSSAVWLHIGVLGPKIVQLPGNGTRAPLPPARVADNPMSILDVCDLVFVDPVSTGYSRAEKDTPPSAFHGLESDIESVGDFIRRWISENNRWNSPKYILGESYGGVRVAGLSSHLQSRYGMTLNGIVLLSSLLDFSTLQPAQGNDLAYMVFVPAMTAVAHFHGKIKGDRDALVNEATAFAFGDYAAALIKGAELTPVDRMAIAGQLAKYTGIDADVCLQHDLRLNPSFFRAELLRSEGKIIGRFDGRVTWDSTNTAAQMANYDPSYSLALGVFSTAMLDYLGRDLGYKEDQPYEILTGKVQPWDWDSNNEVVNLSDRLAVAMRDNPHLRVLTMCGYTDLATPPAGVIYSMRHMRNLSPETRKNLSVTYYDGGHMFYLNPPDLIKSRADLLEFIQAGAR